MNTLQILNVFSYLFFALNALSAAAAVDIRAPGFLKTNEERLSHQNGPSESKVSFYRLNAIHQPGHDSKVIVKSANVTDKPIGLSSATLEEMALSAIHKMEYLDFRNFDFINYSLSIEDIYNDISQVHIQFGLAYDINFVFPGIIKFAATHNVVSLVQVTVQFSNRSVSAPLIQVQQTKYSQEIEEFMHPIYFGALKREHFDQQLSAVLEHILRLNLIPKINEIVLLAADDHLHTCRHSHCHPLISE